MREITPGLHFIQIMLNQQPDAMAWVTGNRSHRQLSGLVKFYHTDYEGILIEAEFFGLPNVNMPNSTNFYAMHIHENGDCSNNFTQTGMHYTLQPAPHPQHSGDLLPLLGNQGYAWSAFYDKRLVLSEILGRSVIVHSLPDDFTSQPAGNSGEKIGCGVIR